jgi:hypothetical protein
MMAPGNQPARRAYSTLHTLIENKFMIHSMTGYASTTRELTGAALSVEIRSVNHRYLDLQFRLPEELRVLAGLSEGVTVKGGVPLLVPAGVDVAAPLAERVADGDGGV